MISLLMLSLSLQYTVHTARFIQYPHQLGLESHGKAIRPLINQQADRVKPWSGDKDCGQDRPGESTRLHSVCSASIVSRLHHQDVVSKFVRREWRNIPSL